MTNRLTEARSHADRAAADAQAKNRLWWERMPMTYADWQAEDRLPETGEDFRAMRVYLLAHSPFLRERFDAAALAGRAALDLGSGSGVLSCLLAEAGAHVTAADLTEAAVSLTRRAAEYWRVPVRTVRADAENLSFADGAFDYVLSWGVLHHSRDTERAFREVARVLRPGGAGLVMVYHRSSAVYYLKGLWWLIAKGKIFSGHTLESVQDFYTDGYYHRHFTRRELADALQASGLSVARITVTQMQKKILPLVPGPLDRWLKSRIGWLIVAEFTRPEA